jgi:hypothetical protein
MLGRLELIWEKDWPRSITLTQEFLRVYPDFGPAREKLYGALVAYGDALLAQGDKDGAVQRLEQAVALLPERGEAPAMLLALTPTPVPTVPAPTVQPPPQPKAPPAKPVAPVRPPAAAPTKSPLSPR